MINLIRAYIKRNVIFSRTFVFHVICIRSGEITRQFNFFSIFPPLDEFFADNITEELLYFSLFLPSARRRWARDERERRNWRVIYATLRKVLINQIGAGKVFQ